MRLTKSLLSILSALALATGAAFADGISMSQSYESSPEALGGYEFLSDGDVVSSSERFSYPMNGSETLAFNDCCSPESDQLSMAESDVIYIYPMEVTEYFVLVPSADSDLSLG